MRLLDRLRRMGFLDRRATSRRNPEVDAAVKHSVTQIDRTRELVEELTRLEVTLVTRPKPKR